MSIIKEEINKFCKKRRNREDVRKIKEERKYMRSRREWKKESVKF